MNHAIRFARAALEALAPILYPTTYLVCGAPSVLRTIGQGRVGRFGTPLESARGHCRPGGSSSASTSHNQTGILARESLEQIETLFSDSAVPVAEASSRCRSVLASGRALILSGCGRGELHRLRAVARQLPAPPGIAGSQWSLRNRTTCRRQRRGGALESVCIKALVASSSSGGSIRNVESIASCNRARRLRERVATSRRVASAVGSMKCQRFVKQNKRYRGASPSEP